jgi:hypothetical protein
MKLSSLVLAALALSVTTAQAQSQRGALEAQANAAQDGATVVRHIKSVLGRSGVSKEAIEVWLRTNSANLSKLNPERISTVLAAKQHWEIELAFVAAPIEQGTTYEFAQAMELGNLTFVESNDQAKIGLASERDQQLVFTPITPCRIADSRSSAGGPGPLQANAPRLISVAGLTSYRPQGGSNGNCGLSAIPAAEIQSVVAAVSTFNQNGAGTLAAYEQGAANPLPNGAIQTFRANDSGAVTSFAVLNANLSTAALTNLISTARTDYSVDVIGYFARPKATELDCVSVTTSSFAARLSFLYFPHPSCPSGYTKVSASCYGNVGASSPSSGTIGVSNPAFAYLSGTGPAGCTFQNLTSITQALGAETRCCRLPGR